MHNTFSLWSSKAHEE